MWAAWSRHGSHLDIQLGDKDSKEQVSSFLGIILRFSLTTIGFIGLTVERTGEAGLPAWSYAFIRAGNAYAAVLREVDGQ